VLLVALGLVHHLVVLAVAYAATLMLAAVSRLPVGFFVKRVWLFVPIFTGIMVLPATLSVVTHGQVVVQLWTWHGHPEGLTAQGLTSAALVVARVACSISLVVLVTLTTPWVRLLSALGALGVPRIFVLIIGMAYRYVFLLLGTVTDMYTARKARTVTTAGHDRSARAFLGASAGAVFGKAHHLSEEVHQAMVARGYRGDAHTLHAFRLTGTDLVASAAMLLAAIAVYGGDRILGR
jgi:cobalt/nickel transport system permease protein